MGTPENCPCDSVLDLKDRVAEIEKKVQSDSTTLAVMQRDIQFIKDKVTEKSKFNGQILSSIVQTIAAVLIAYIAAKVGLG